MAYYTRNDLPFYYALADAYTVCDANYCSEMGPTFPNRIYLFTGMIDPNGTGGGPVTDNTVLTNGFRGRLIPSDCRWRESPGRFIAGPTIGLVMRCPGLPST